MGRRSERSWLSFAGLALAAALAGSGCGGGGPAPGPAAAPAADEAMDGRGGSGGGEVAAWIDGEPIHVAELERQAATALLPIRQQRYDVLRAKLDEVVSRRLLQAEAAARGLSEQELISREIGSKVQSPGEEDIQEAWNAVRDQVDEGETLEQWRPRFEREIRRQRMVARLQQYLAELKQQAGYRLELDPPRIDVPVPSGEPSRGPGDAPVTVVEFSDFDCPFCKRTHPAVERLLDEYGDRVHFVYRDFPLAIHERAVPAARAARCAGEQDRYWDYFELLMEDDAGLADADLTARAEALDLDLDAFTECLASDRHRAAIQTSIVEARELGVTGTPTFFVNGRLLEGSQTYEALKAVVDEELARTM